MSRVLQFLFGLLLISTPVHAEGGEHGKDNAHHKQVDWPFDGPFGKLDKQAAQRGYQVYKEVCSACHSMNLVSYRNLAEIGFPEGEIKTLAAEKQVKDGPGDDGEMFDRPGRPSDHFPAPFANEQAARAGNGGALPPDLSLIVKARHDGANYVHNLLTGYEQAKFYRCTETYPQGACKHYEEADEASAKTDKERVTKLSDARKKFEADFAARVKAKPQNGADGKPLPPANLPALTTEETAAMKAQVLHCMSIEKMQIDEMSGDKATGRKLDVEKCNELAPGKYYNPVFPGGQISMAPPLADDRVSYMDETKATLDQQAKDVTVFLQWAAEPEMERRKAMGIKTILFLIFASVFLYLAKKRVWADVRENGYNG